MSDTDENCKALLLFSLQILVTELDLDLKHISAENFWAMFNAILKNYF